MDGFINKRILKIDLTTRKITIEEKDESFYRKYLGGKGIALMKISKRQFN